MFADLDLIGREDMEKELYVIVKGVEVHLKPSGIRCRLCPLMDDGWDPVVLAIRGVKTYTKWCKTTVPRWPHAGSLLPLVLQLLGNGHQPLMCNADLDREVRG